MKADEDILHPSQDQGRLSQWIHLLASTVVIFALAYFLGRTMLTAPVTGNDSALHIAYATWLDQYFPNVPHWYPLQGGGQSLLHGYPVLAHLVVAVTHRLSGLSTLQAYRLISFLTLPLTATGIYFLGWVVLRRQSIGLIAAIFYLLAPISWTWIYDWGFLAQSVAVVFLPFCLICFDQYLSHLLSRTPSAWQRPWFVALVVGLALASLTHPFVGAGALAGMALYSLTLSVVAKPKRRGRILRKGLGATLSSGVVAGLLLAFYLVPFYQYGQVANREGLNVPAPHQINRFPVAEFFGLRPIDPRQILTRIAFPLVVTSFLLVGVVLAPRYSRKALALGAVSILGSIYALTPEMAIALMKISPTFAAVFNLRALLMVVIILSPLCAAFGVWAVARTLISPDVALRRRMPKDARPALPPGLRSRLTSGLAFVLAGAAIVQLGGVFPVKAYHVSYGPLPDGIDIRDLWDRRADDPCILPPGDPGRSGLCEVPQARANLNIEEFRQHCVTTRAQGFKVPPLCTAPSPTGAMVAQFLERCRWAMDFRGTMAPCRAQIETVLEQLVIQSWPGFMLSDEDPNIARSRRLAALLPDETPLRIDVSEDLGRVAQDLTAFSRASQINSYTFQISLIHAMWGYQQSVFYAMNPASPEDGRPYVLGEAAKWFGTEYVFLNPELDPVHLYAAAGWQRTLAQNRVEIWQHPSQPGYLFVDPGADSLETYRAQGWKPVLAVGPIQVWRFPDAPGLATLTSRPAVLVISREDIGAYEPLFRLANRGAIPYDEALIVQGKDRLDSYSLEELQRFDALFLHGYTYTDSSRAWALLEQYVRQGGSLYVDTGWEWTVPEWQFAEAPPVLPVSRLTWTNYGISNRYRLHDREIGGQVDPTKFDPLIWQEMPWSVSGVRPDEVRDWGRVVLSVDGQPLIVAGRYGQGRVVWSGMLLANHASHNRQEIQLLRNLVAWLTAPREARDYPVTVTRDHPDRIAFGMDLPAGDTATLYWREAYSPEWHAFLETDDGRKQELSVYRGGPGFMLIRVPTQPGREQVVLEYRLPLVARVATAISAVTWLLLLKWTLEGTALGRSLIGLIPQVLTKRPLPALALKQRVITWWEDIEV